MGICYCDVNLGKMKDPTISSDAPADRKPNASVLDAFDLLKAPKDDGKLIGGAKIIAQLQSNEVSFPKLIHNILA